MESFRSSVSPKWSDLCLSGPLMSFPPILRLRYLFHLYKSMYYFSIPPYHSLVWALQLTSQKAVSLSRDLGLKAGTPSFNFKYKSRQLYNFICQLTLTLTCPNVGTIIRCLCLSLIGQCPGILACDWLTLSTTPSTAYNYTWPGISSSGSLYCPLSIKTMLATNNFTLTARGRTWGSPPSSGRTSYNVTHGSITMWLGQVWQRTHDMRTDG